MISRDDREMAKLLAERSNKKLVEETHETVLDQDVLGMPVGHVLDGLEADNPELYFEIKRSLLGVDVDQLLDRLERQGPELYKRLVDYIQYTHKDNEPMVDVEPEDYVNQDFNTAEQPEDY